MKIITLALVCAACTVIFFSAQGCSSGNETLINTAHLDHLYEEGMIEDQKVGYINIYSEYPEYQHTPAAGEGIACVDDVARAALFYMGYFRLRPDENILSKTRNLLRFILAMQADNGYFFNFISDDLTINKT
ncbi:MAG: hypothetical protein GF313_14740, partial [Caldithrix sp.]|nr:hypothetical protein [Caldithrix sp.]